MTLPRIAAGKSSAQPVASESSRDVPLEALRGFAALVVVAWHFFLGFDPDVLSNPSYGVRGTPFFAFLHGSAAVSVFFVLSGYVLTRRYFETGDKRVLIIGAAKRWFRLFLPVFLSVMLSWLFFAGGLYAYEDAGAISHSDWLTSFGFSMIPPFEPNFLAAIINGFSETVYHDVNAFNPLLWTIHIELIGSYLAFAFAALIKWLRGRDALIALMLVLGVLSLHFINLFLINFLAGTLLAYYAPHFKTLKHTTAIVFIALSLVFLGYREPIGFYAMFDFLNPINGESLRAYTSTIGAVFIMMSFVGYAPLRRRLQGRAARALGRMSFPIYLVHIILLFSLGSTVFVLAKDGNSNGVALLITALDLIPAILVLAAVFVVIDIKWIAFVNSAFRRIKIAG